MIQVNLLIPLFRAPQTSTPQQLVHQIKKMTGFEQISLYSTDPLLESTNSPTLTYNKEQQITHVVAGTPELDVSMGEIVELWGRVGELERQNGIMKGDLAALFSRSQGKKMEEGKVQEPSKQVENSKNIQSESEVHQVGPECSTRASLQQQIKRLVSDKLSKQQQISKLTVYCEYLIKIIEAKKLPIF